MQPYQLFISFLSLYFILFFVNCVVNNSDQAFKPEFEDSYDNLHWLVVQESLQISKTNWNINSQLDQVMALQHPDVPVVSTVVGQSAGGVAAADPNSGNQTEHQQQQDTYGRRYPHLNVKGRYYINTRTNKKVYQDSRLSDSTVTPDGISSDDDDDVPPAELKEHELDELKEKELRK